MAQDVWAALGLEWGVAGAVGAAPTPLVHNEGDMVDVALQKTLREYDCEPLSETAPATSDSDHQAGRGVASFMTGEAVVNASDLFEELST
jgi:hypothetical protein